MNSSKNKKGEYPNIIYIPKYNKSDEKRQILFNTIEYLSEDFKFTSTTNINLYNRKLNKKELVTLNELKDRNTTILTDFYNVKKKTVNLNDFYNNINKSHFLDTYSSKLLLVARNDLNHTLIEKFTDNFINNLNLFKKHINEYKNENQFLNYTVYDAFNFNQLLNVDKDIPIHESSKPIYIKNNLLKTKTIFETNI